MDDTQWERIQDLFHAALDRPETERESFITSACRSDDELADVRALVEEDARASSLLDRGLRTVARSLLTDDAPGTLIDRFVGPYRLRSVLGEGGMGVVYLAARPDLARDVAIKVMRGALSPARAQRFAIEQRTLAQLNHPAIARLYDADVLPDGTSWFAMEFVDGVSLTVHCRAHVPTLAGRLALFSAICEAVQHAHQHLIVHRDLKPSNILVTPAGELKLLDFGIAKQLDAAEETRADPTITSLRRMTPAYAAPEQFRGAGSASTPTCMRSA